MSVNAIIQARTGSTRLPGKILKRLGDVSVIERLYSRVKQTAGLDGIVIAMPQGEGDDALAEHVRQFCPNIFRGAEADVLARYAGAAVAYPSDLIVRITSDCPFFDPDILAQMLVAFHQQKPDYMTNSLDPHLPRGLDADVFTAKAIHAAAKQATAAHQREHVTPFIYQNLDLFDVVGFSATPDNYADLRWTLDTPEDWTLIATMFDLLEVPFEQARLGDFLDLYKDHPKLRDINAAITQKKLED